MQVEPRHGIRVDLLAGRYQPARVSRENPALCWDYVYQTPLRELSASLNPDGGGVCPFPQVECFGSNPISSVQYLAVDAKTHRDVLGSTRPISRTRIPRWAVNAVQKVVDEVHCQAERQDQNMPSELRGFYRNFRLPDPNVMPECWRVGGRFGHKRVYVLWGLEKANSKNGGFFYPASKQSEKWKDGVARETLARKCGCFGFGPLLRSSVGAVTETFTSRSQPKGNDGAGYLPNGTISSEMLRNEDSSRNVFGGLVGVGTETETRTEGDVALDSPRQASGCLSRILRFVLGSLIFVALLAALFWLIASLPSCRSRSNSSAGAPVASEDPAAPCAPSAPDAPVSSDEPSKDSPAALPPRSQDPTSGEESVRALACAFRVNDPIFLDDGRGNVANVKFSVAPLKPNIKEKYIVSDWTVNGAIVKAGESQDFSPSGGLRYDRVYTISATVKIDNRVQRVLPYQWNSVDIPTWQIVPLGRGHADGERERYRLICCNSSLITPVVKSWGVGFYQSNRSLSFKKDLEKVTDDEMEMKYDIGYFKGSYFMKMTVDIEYVDRKGTSRNVVHSEVFPFSHDSSATGLTRAKYEVVIPNVYYCLAKRNDGGLHNGTAFAISTRKLLTNYHVAVGGVPETYQDADYRVVGPVTLTNIKGKTYYAKVESSDRGRDLALLRLCDRSGNEVDEELPGYLHLANEGLVKGISKEHPRYVFAIGYPKGTVCMGPPAFTDGKAEEVDAREYAWGRKREKLGTIINYTSTKHGYSGGPLIDFQTEGVLGVNFGGIATNFEKHKAASLATSVDEVRKAFPGLSRK